jgi:DNA-binding transcriptional MerR regulator
MSLMTIGVFAARCRLSPKALRLYDDLGLLVPAATDPVNGYRMYRADQVERARMVGLLRRLDMPLATIAVVLDAPPEEAVLMLREYWEHVEATTAERRALVHYLQARITGAEMTQYEIQTRRIPERRVLSINRHLNAAETDAFFNEAFARLRSAGPGLTGVDGAPYLIFYGEVSDDSDGPMELCRPVSEHATPAVEELGVDIESRVEPAHDEAFVRLSMAEMGWPAMLPVVDALEAWTVRERRQPTGALRQVLIADQRTADPQALVCDLTIPLTILAS